MRLYKYLSPYHTRILENQMVRFSQPSVLNDPYELKPHISSIMSKEDTINQFSQLLPGMIDDEYSKIPLHMKALLQYDKFQQAMTTIITSSESMMLDAITKHTPAFADMIYDTMDKLIGIFCLSENPDNELMWSHYADSHQGFVIEFDSEAYFFNQKKSNFDEFRHLKEIKYSDQRPSITLNKVRDFTPFLTKGSQWSYEKEWRMMLPLADASQVIEQEVANIYLFKFPYEALRSIVFGYRMDAPKRAYIRGIVKSSSQFDHIKFYEAKIGKTDYRVTIEECPAT